MLSQLQRWPDCLLPEASSELDELRADALRAFILLTAFGYVIWHVLSTTVWSQNAMFRAYAIAPIAVLVLAASYRLLARDLRAASGTYLGGSFLAITWALYVLSDGSVALLYPLLAMVATFVAGPLAGLATTLASAAALISLATLRPSSVQPADVAVSVAFSGFTVAGVWALITRLFHLLHWYATSYAEAERHARESRDHRAQLLQAWKQLDAAYYRLEHLNSALQLAWKAAEAAERAKLEFAVNISHELRTPLNLIVGYSEMMLTSPGSYGDVPLPRAYRGDLDAIHRGAQHLLALTDDVLDLARVDVGRLGMSREPVDLAQIVRDAVDLVRDYVESKGLRVDLDLPDSAPVLLLDRLRIRQVLLNLLTNAARFTERGAIRVEVRIRERDVLVRVSDTGPGIPPEDLSRVFEQFVTHDHPREGWHSGTGLGLPISKRFVELHQGEMGVESRLGVGTTFWFTLPLTAAPVSAAGTGPAVLIPAGLPARPTVVLISSDREVAHLFQRHLGDYCLEAVTGWPEAVARAAETKASVILANSNLSVDPDEIHLPVVRCSLPSAARRAERLGVRGFLAKPVSRRALLAAIRGLGRPVREVLVVDDDPRFVRLVTRMLESSGDGYLTLAAHNGEEALALMRTRCPDLCLLDQSMPGLDGIGVLREIARDPALQKVAVIVISAHGEDEGNPLFGTEVRISNPAGFRLDSLAQLIRVVVESGNSTRAHLAATEGLRPATPPG